MKTTTKPRLAAYAIVGIALTAFGTKLWRDVRRTTTGQSTQNPSQLSAGEWKRALMATKNAIGDKDLAMFAAGVSYFGTLAFFPSLAAFVAFFAFFAEPQQIIATTEAAKNYLPGDMADFISQQLTPLASNPQQNLLAGILAIAIALFSASSGMQNLIKALNHSYDAEETRGFIKLRLISFGLVLGVMALAIPILALLVMKVEFLTHLGAPDWLAAIIIIGRWIVLALVVTLGLATFYRYAPNRRKPRWQIVSWGGTAATLIWLGGTALFFVYVQYFASFSKTYGVFAGLIILMTWLNLSSFIILAGAEVNNHLERETSATP